MSADNSAYVLACQNFVKGNWEAALLGFETALQANPWDFTIIDKMADLFIISHQNERLGTLLDMAQNQPETGHHPEWLAHKRAIWLARKGDLVNSLHLFDKAIAAAPERHDILAHKAQVCGGLKRQAESGALLKRASQLASAQKDYESTAFYLRDLHARMNAYPDKEEEKYEAVFRLPGTREVQWAISQWEARNRELMYLLERGVETEALQMATDIHTFALENFGPTHPHRVSSCNNLAQVTFSLGHHQEGLLLIQKAIDISGDTLGPDHPVTLNIARSKTTFLFKMGHRQEALAELENICRKLVETLGPSHPENILGKAHLASYYYHFGHYDRALTLYREAYVAIREPLGDEHPQTLSCLNGIAMVFCAMGRIDEALAHYCEILEIRKATFGDCHEDTLFALNNLATTLAESGRIKEAGIHFEELVQLHRRTFGTKSRATLISVNNTASFYQKSGLFENAIATYQEALAISVEVFGAEHPDSLKIRNNLATCCHLSGQLSQAHKMLDDILGLSIQVNGEGHPETLTAMNNKSAVLLDMGRFAEAAELSGKVHFQRLDLLGEDHPETMNALNNLANIYRKMGDLPAAGERFAELLTRRTRVLGAEHPETMNSRNNLATMNHLMGHDALARELHLTNLNMRMRLFGKRHPDTTLSLSNLATTLQSMGQLEEAEELLVEALEWQQRMTGTAHFNTIGILENLATVKEARGAYHQVETLLVQAHTESLTHLGPKNPVTINCMLNLANHLYVQGRIDRAERLFKECLGVCDQVFGPNNLQTLTCISCLANVSMSRHQYKRARSLCDQLLEQYLKLFGEQHPLTLQTRLKLAQCFEGQGRFQEAGKIAAEILAINRNVRGENHPDTIFAHHDLACILDRLSEFDMAGRHHQIALEAARQKLGDVHPKTLNILKAAALHNWRRQNWERADNYWMEVHLNGNRFYQQVLWRSGEVTRRAYQASFEDTRNMFTHYFCERGAAGGPPVLRFSLARKSRLFTLGLRIRQKAHASGGEEVDRLLQRLEGQKTRLSRIWWGGDESLSQAEREAYFDTCTEDIRRLEAQLAASIQPDSHEEPALEDLVSILAPDRALVDFNVYQKWSGQEGRFGQYQLSAVVLSASGSCVLLDLGPLAPIQELLLSLRSLIQDRRLAGRIIKIAQRLYQLLWQPLIPHLEKAETVFLVPDGLLHLLPFQVLVDEVGKYLLDLQHIIYLSSPHELLHLNRNATISFRKVAIFAAPDYQDVETTNNAAPLFQELLHAQREADLVEGCFRECGVAPECFSGRRASIGHLKALTQPDILHIASHGFCLESVGSKPGAPESLQGKAGSIGRPHNSGEEQPYLSSGLALAGAHLKNIDSADDNGLFMATEASTLNLAGTQLVVLSACWTNAGRIVTGEGVYGLRRAFQEAGARVVVSSLWPVSDQFTPAFMVAFYRHLLNGQPPHRALLQAQGDFRKIHPHPYHWASFVAFGS